LRKLIFALVLCGCASQGVPPGGPPDAEAPKVIAITPDSGATSVKRGTATFRFDEVVSEKPPAATTLGDLFIVSPRQGVPDVSWHREEIRVKLRKGWLPNTTYTVTLLPGLADLRGNVKNTGSSTFFSTGSVIDRAVMHGTVYDLLTGTPVRGAAVEARTGTDTTVSWVTVADTSGGFRLEHLPPRNFFVRAYQDKNRNFGVDPDEASDTSTVAAGDTSAANFFIVVRDSIAPRITSALAVDSVTLNVVFDRPSDSASALNSGAYSIIGTDSTVIPIRSVSLPPRDTTHRRPSGARAMPVAAVTIALGSPLAAKKSYLLRAVGIRGLLGQTAPSEIRVTLTPQPSTPVRPPPPSNLPGGAVPIPIKHD
jgi:hypothetical protein